jgi:hypothetical protein
MKRTHCFDDREDTKKLKQGSLQYVPKDVPINIREESKEQFLKADAPTSANLLRSLLRVCERAKGTHRSEDILRCYDELEQISASRKPDESKIIEIQQKLSGMGIILNSFVPREKTDKDYDIYLAEKAEEKMNIRRALRLT